MTGVQTCALPISGGQADPGAGPRDQLGPRLRPPGQHRPGPRDHLANGAAEEVFFRGALYAAIGEKYPVALSTGAYTLATVTTRNPALVLAAGAMGTLFAAQRRASGGIQAPVLTHLTWSVLMLRYLPPLFRDQERARS